MEASATSAVHAVGPSTPVVSSVMPAAPIESLTQLVPGATRSLAHLSDSEVLAMTRHLTGKSNQVFAALLVHLAEVESRGLHRTRACTSLYTYCIYELRMSEDAAARRAGAAKLLKRFPVLFEVIANGELHLTGLLMLGPHLTPENHLKVLALAKFRTKKEIGKLVRTLAPLPEVPDSIEPLRPAPMRSLRAPTWAEFVASLCPPVRELRPGERPRDWANDPLAPTTVAEASSADGEAPAPARVKEAETPAGEGEPLAPAPEGPAPARVEQEGLAPPSARTKDHDGVPARARVEAARAEVSPLTAPQLYQIQFTASEEHVKLVERAKALLSRQSPGKTLGDLHLQAMRLLVAALEKQRFAVTSQPPSPRPPSK